MTNRKKVTRTIAIAVAAVAATFVAVPSVVAHGTCGGDANGPYKDSGQVKTAISYICGDQHDRYIVSGCLQKKVNGVFENRECRNLDDSGPGWNQTSFTIRPNYPCSAGVWRGLFKYGAAKNNSGAIAHEQTLNEPSPEIDINVC